jgi:hypothetical protein
MQKKIIFFKKTFNKHTSFLKKNTQYISGKLYKNEFIEKLLLKNFYFEGKDYLYYIQQNKFNIFIKNNYKYNIYNYLKYYQNNLKKNILKKLKKKIKIKSYFYF